MRLAGPVPSGTGRRSPALDDARTTGLGWPSWSLCCWRWRAASRSRRASSGWQVAQRSARSRSPPCADTSPHCPSGTSMAGLWWSRSSRLRRNCWCAECCGTPSSARPVRCPGAGGHDGRLPCAARPVPWLERGAAGRGRGRVARRAAAGHRRPGSPGGGPHGRRPRRLVAAMTRLRPARVLLAAALLLLLPVAYLAGSPTPRRCTTAWACPTSRTATSARPRRGRRGPSRQRPAPKWSCATGRARR